MSGSSTVDDVLIERAAVEFGTPTYVYFTHAIAERIDLIKSAFADRFVISYAVKSNPNPALLAWLKSRIKYLDISSIGELRLGRRADWEPADMSFTGPGKREAELQEAIGSGLGELVIESVAEAVLADRLARQIGQVQNVLLRITPDLVPKGFGDQMAGRPSAFGIDVETIDDELPKIISLKNLNIVGFHIYAGTQCLVPEAIVESYRGSLNIFRKISEKYDLTPQKLVFGSGLGIPYFENDLAVRLDEVAKGIAGELDTFQQDLRFRTTELVLEMGRFLVGEAGYFVTRVTAIKNSRGVRFGICDGGMNNHLPASGNFGMVIHRNYKMHRVGGGEAREKINLAGPLCTPLDRIGVGVTLPPISVGDLIAVHSSGAYGLTASPVYFISHPLPQEVLVEGLQLRNVTRMLSDLVS
jgi:diaminopimelate decarboxylase